MAVQFRGRLFPDNMTVGELTSQFKTENELAEFQQNFREALVKQERIKPFTAQQLIDSI